MEDVVLGIDLGTSAVKTIAVNQCGEVIGQTSEPLTLIQPKPGYNEQDPESWVNAVKESIKTLIKSEEMKNKHISGASFSGQMHGLVALDKQGEPIRNAILWNDTRTTEQCQLIKNHFGDTLLENPILEGFTLPKLLWLQQNEPKHWQELSVFLLPKDYVRYKMTGDISMEYSDAAGTLLLNPDTKQWDKSVGAELSLGNIYPKLMDSHEYVGNFTEDVKASLELENDVCVFAGGADNACGALGAGVINETQTLCSIGTSGVVLTCMQGKENDLGNNIHYFNHALSNMTYTMGVTLSAGDSLNWLKQTFFDDASFDDIVQQASNSEIGANGLLFTPYLQGERTPHGDAFIRGSFIGLNRSTTKADIARATIEGITYSLYESYQYMSQSHTENKRMISIGGGAKNSFWLQLQADVFNTEVTTLKYEEGPSMGAAMLAAYGLGWFESMEAFVDAFIKYDKTYYPNLENHKTFGQYFNVYQQVYSQTQTLTQQLLNIK
ncbi:xylulokinase [Staphylococcus edaphicus]|uniref:Xylulose kinase n=1 Tax=Staphylococcus edaphicus TaxID=1955013 RepID=A0A2C6WFS4_9STAP|nr:xylulokinase [Staphylococcus edaphicus]PHK49668.1 xylulokinase [Staphylococcus edaphicus]UQW81910.1 xylulokinase [Staphylococcus edaphicus]